MYCYFDGVELRPHADGAGRAAQSRLAREFVFPSGRRCATFDDLAQGCQDEWSSARDLLRQGVFTQFFTATGRADIVKAIQDALKQGDPDIALIRFVNSLPVSRPQAPRLDLSPRRFLLGNLQAGEKRQLQILVSNQGQGMLQGTLKVTEGGQWLRIAEGATSSKDSDGQCLLRIARDQKITLHIDTRGLEAAQTYGGKLTVITNGGVVEVPVRMDLVARPFPRPPFQGAKTPRDMAERMRTQPKAAVPLLENGEMARWFAANGWKFPVRDTPARGVAGIQQFFEAMGLSKPPQVQVTQPEVRFTCTFPDTLRFQVTLHTSARKWVYANIESDSPWLKVLTPQVSGPQQATIGFEVDSRALAAAQTSGRSPQGQVKIVANAGQSLAVRVVVELRGFAPVKTRRFLQPVLVLALGALLLRLALVPVADVRARLTASRAAAERLMKAAPKVRGKDAAGEKAVAKLGPDSPLNRLGGWLQLPWNVIWLAGQDKLKADVFKPGDAQEIITTEYRHYFVSYFVRRFALGMFWVGALAMLVMLWRKREGPLDLLWALIAGIVVGVVSSATLACLVLVAEIPLQGFWGQGHGGLFPLLAWIVVVVLYWAAMGALAGLLLGWFGPARRLLIEPVQRVLAQICRFCGLKGLADYCAAP